MTRELLDSINRACQASIMETVTTVQENAADILASAKDLNAQRTEQETADTLGQVEGA